MTQSVFIFDLSELLLQLEVQVIARFIDLNTLPQTRHTVQVLKEGWLIHRLEEMRLVHFHRNHHQQKLPTDLLDRMKNITNYTTINLDKILYQSIHIPPFYSSRHGSLEVRYGDVYITYG